MNQKATVYMPQAKPHDCCRNLIVDKFLKTDCDWLLMVDSDVVPPVDVLDMKKNDVPVCSAHVSTFINGEIIPVGMTKNKDGYHHDFKHSSPNLHEVDATGTGCILIKRDVFKSLKKPYFSFVYNKDGFIEKGEDFNFTDKIDNVYFDGRYRCKHYTTIAI